MGTIVVEGKRKNKEKKKAPKFPGGSYAKFKVSNWVQSGVLPFLYLMWSERSSVMS